MKTQYDIVIKVIPKRWIVERNLAWSEKQRRL